MILIVTSEAAKFEKIKQKCKQTCIFRAAKIGKQSKSIHAA